ncbi:MAG: ATP-binding protein [Syntrophales bacterium]|nr:ATP-binding protein [Syntrophales bacterium]
MQLKFLKFFKKKFGTKIVAIVTLFIFVVSFSFTAFFYHHQSKLLTDGLIHNNLLLAGILAYNSRIGVFSENEELLRNPVDGIFQQEETEEVSIFNLNGRLLLMRERSGRQDVKKPDKADKKAEQIETKIFDKLKASASPFYLEGANKMEFWSPVIASTGYREAESLFIEEKLLRGKERLIGCVRITVGKSALDKKLGALLMKSLVIGLVFLIVCSGIIYITVKRIVNPLNTLIKGVQTLGKGDFGGKVPVETEDEIGNLAMAFNQMSESLLRREAEKKQLEERLRHSQRMETIGTLAGGIAHDFNNILGIIMGYAQVALLTPPEKTDMPRYLREILKASARAADLVRQIITFSRQGNQERNPLLVKPIIEEALKMMRASLPAAIEIRHNFKPGLSPVLSDPTQIHQVLMNLCTNAGHAMQDGGGVIEVNLDEVEIDAGDPDLFADMQPGRYQILTVSDTGHGMDASVNERIFDPFFTTKGPGKGTGLGLSVVHGIVKSHGGKISCHSVPGKGTTFQVYFPTVEEEPSERPEQFDSIPLGRERILFVDDEAALVDIGKQMLQSLGYHVVTRTSSIEALEAFRTQPDQFDLLITDNTMPNMTGVELAKNIKRIRPDMPVILCTGFSESVSEEKVKALGIAGFMMKPIIRKNLARVIRHALEHGEEINDGGVR